MVLEEPVGKVSSTTNDITFVALTLASLVKNDHFEFTQVLKTSKIEARKLGCRFQKK